MLLTILYLISLVTRIDIFMQRCLQVRALVFRGSGPLCSCRTFSLVPRASLCAGARGPGPPLTVLGLNPVSHPRTLHIHGLCLRPRGLARLTSKPLLVHLSNVGLWKSGSRCGVGASLAHLLPQWISMRKYSSNGAPKDGEESSNGEN